MSKQSPGSSELENYRRAAEEICRAERKNIGNIIVNLENKVDLNKKSLQEEINGIRKNVRGNGGIGALEEIRNLQKDVNGIKAMQKEHSDKLNILLVDLQEATTWKKAIKFFWGIIKYIVIILAVCFILKNGGKIFNLQLYDKVEDSSKQIEESSTEEHKIIIDENNKIKIMDNK